MAKTTLDLNAQLQQVIEFMTVVGQTVNTLETYATPKVADFRTRLIEEEVFGKKELVDSMNNDDVVGVLDGLCDVLYVTYGALATYGLELDTSVSHPVEIADGGSKQIFKHTAFELIRSISGAVEQYKRGVELGDFRTMIRGLGNVIFQVTRIAEEYNISLQEPFAEVHASNMSKLCTTEQQAIDSIAERVEANNDKSADYIGATIARVEVNGKEYFVIRRAADNKVLKGNGFFEPNLAKYV